ncbi:MAG TPA: hypothetical protein DCG72_11190 [Gammaproteobacteria bacterium]|nr:hypothetical protein [Gammaproteobacteria bacterium]
MTDPLIEWRTNRHRRDTTREVVKHVESKEVLNQDWIARLERVERLLDNFANSQEFILPRAFAELVERVENLEQRPTDITPSDSFSQDDIQLLAQAASETGAAVSGLLQTLAVLDKRIDALEARVSRIPRAMLEEYMHSLQEIQSRTA